MDALKQSLAKRGLPAEAADAKKPPTKAGPRRRREAQGRRSGRTEEARAGRPQVTTTASSRVL